jgi:hypothetical protein
MDRWNGKYYVFWKVNPGKTETGDVNPDEYIFPHLGIHRLDLSG